MTTLQRIEIRECQKIGYRDGLRGKPRKSRFICELNGIDYVDYISGYEDGIYDATYPFIKDREIVAQ